ncbi:MAG: Ig-like domain-containing protein, partial [Clostridia bacterium]|nr:Ig-like domain-containing protein [Clostridia bacterium]
KKATCSITIGIPADTVEFTTDDYTALAVGKTLTLKAKAYREDGEKPVSTNVVYEIVEGDERIATIDEKGKLKGVGIGEVVVRATAEAGTEEAFAEITINVCIPATKVTLNKTKAAMAYGEGDLVLVAEMLPLDNTDTLTWESSDEEIAVVEEIEEGVAVVTALKEEGKVKITAITGSGKKATCSVTIGLAADTVEFSSLKATSVAVGKTITLKAKASRNIDDEKPVSTNVEFEIIEGERFAEIDAKGKLKGIEEGYVTVRAWAEAGTEDAYEDVVIKVCVPATKVTVYPTKTEMAVGEDMYLEAEMISSVGDCTDDLFWTTSDEEIATVDEDGLVTAHSEGSVKITAMAGSGKKATCTIKVVEAPEEPEEPEVPEEPDVPEGTFQELVLHDLSYEFIEDPFIIEANPGAIGGMEIRATVVAPSNVKDVLIAEWGTGISGMSPEEIQETAELYAAMWKEYDTPIMTDTQTPFEIITAHPVGEGEIDSHPQVLLIGLDEDYNAVGYYIVDPDGYVVE